MRRLDALVAVIVIGQPRHRHPALYGRVGWCGGCGPLGVKVNRFNGAAGSGIFFYSFFPPPSFFCSSGRARDRLLEQDPVR